MGGPKEAKEGSSDANGKPKLDASGKKSGSTKKGPILFVNLNSSGSRAALYFLAVSGIKKKIRVNYLDFEKGDNHDPEFLKISPKGLVPALYERSKNITIWETTTLLQYLAETYEPKFHPTPLDGAQIDRRFRMYEVLTFWLNEFKKPLTRCTWPSLF